MPRFGERSQERLASCHPQLQELLREAIKYTDFSVIWGFRGKDDQDRFFREGTSTKRWPQSLHNRRPSEAVDVAPWPIDWEDEKRFIYLAGVIMTLAFQLDIPLRWGGAWKGEWNPPGVLNDLAHFELKEI